MSKPELKPIEVFYPESDGKPMAETELHRDLLIHLLQSAALHFEGDPETYVSGNMLLYYREGHPEFCVAPDVFIVRGIAKRIRRIYKVWEEGKGPDVVVELTSLSTHREDLEGKKGIYERIGVREYFIFDPEGRRFNPAFRGYRLKDGVLEPVPPARIVAGRTVYISEVLGLELHGRGPSLRWLDPAAGHLLPTSRELFHEAVAAKAIAEEATARAEEATSRVEEATSRAEEATSRAEEATSRAEAEKARAEAATSRAEAEKARADRAEAELARLRWEIPPGRGIEPRG